jgi:hypothetical protein
MNDREEFYFLSLARFYVLLSQNTKFPFRFACVLLNRMEMMKKHAEFIYGMFVSAARENAFGVA